MKERFNAENPLALNFDVKMTKAELDAFYFIANLEYENYTEDEVQKLFSNPELLAGDIDCMIDNFGEDDDKDFKNAVIAVWCVLSKQFGEYKVIHEYKAAW